MEIENSDWIYYGGDINESIAQISLSYTDSVFDVMRNYPQLSNITDENLKILISWVIAKELKGVTLSHDANIYAESQMQDYGYDNYNELTDKYMTKNPVMKDSLLSYIVKATSELQNKSIK